MFGDSLTIDECLSAGANGVMIPCEHYHELPGISGTGLFYLSESNKHYDNRRLFFHHTSCLILGNLVHTATLEPDELHARYVRTPKFECKALSGQTIKEQQQEFAEDNKHRIIIGDDDWIKTERMARNVRAICPGILQNSVKERSLFAQWSDDIIIKCRLDIEYQDGSDFDLKTITPKGGDFSDYALLRHIKALNYHVSAAFRNLVRRNLGIQTLDSYLIFVSTSPGHMVKVRQIPPDLIKLGESICRSILESRQDFLTYGFDIEPPKLEF